MKMKSQSDAAKRAQPGEGFADSERYDASERQFAASLNDPCDAVVEESGSLNGPAKKSERVADHEQTSSPRSPLASVGMSIAPASAAPLADPDEWRQEVAARLHNYRARRRPREHRYPSLQLKFDPEEPAWTNPGPSRPAPEVSGYEAAARLAQTGWPADTRPEDAAAPNKSAEPTARIIPFRRSIPTPPKPLEELAEPLQLFPRILEVPEVAPPLPALGGILIEPVPEPLDVKRPGIEIPLCTSPISLRFLAAAADMAVVACAFCLFAYIFSRISGVIPSFKEGAMMASLILGLLWAGYQYLLLTYAGSTPGLKLASLKLAQFDGFSVSRRHRRWRVLASFLSGVSLALGYAWCLLDEDQLCWHDRITKTHLSPTN